MTKEGQKKELKNNVLRKREITKATIWVMLPITIIMGLIYPVLGLFMLVCMFAGVLISIFKGRFWCGWFCPRGSFLEKFFTRFHSNKESKDSFKRTAKNYAYDFFKTKAFRISFLTFMMFMMTIQVYRAWPDPEKIGAALVMLLAITTVISIILGILVHPRTWCAFCPIGTMSSWVANKDYHLKIDQKKCVDCMLCYSVCPVKIDPTLFKSSGKITHKDCLKCEVCLRHCPVGAISK